MLTDELLIYLFDGKPHLLTEPMTMWLDSSRRFTAFVTAFRDKIRKKLRVTQDQETLYDLRLEFETAYLLLQERSLSLEYEPEQSKQVRSPDFAVTYTTSLTFMVEVTRLRAVSKGAVLSLDNESTLEQERLADAICSKLGQFLPQRSNVLIVGVDTLPSLAPYARTHLPDLLGKSRAVPGGVAQNDLQALMLRIQQRAERNDSAFWTRYGFRERADFFRHYQRLSEVLVRGSQLQADKSVITWGNPQAKHPLPSKVRTALYRSHRL